VFTRGAADLRVPNFNLLKHAYLQVPLCTKATNTNLQQLCRMVHLHPS